MVIETLDALARLDYSNFEVLVIDNNTRDEARLAAGRGALRAAGRAFPVLPCRAAGGLQGGRAEFRAAPDRRRCADRRRDRQRLRGRAELAARAGARIPGSAHRDRPGAAGLSRRRPERLQGDVLRRVSRLLPHRHDHAQRAQRHHSARHHDPGAAQPAARPAAAGPSGALPRTRSSGCGSSRPASRRSTCPRATAAA